MSEHCEVNVERAERYWRVYVPKVDRVTQARSLREVPVMARDLIEAKAQAEAAAEYRAAARELAEDGLTYRDIGGAMGSSHQRAEQLVKSG